MNGPNYTPESTRLPDAPGVQILAGDGRLWSFALPGRSIRPEIAAGRVASFEHVCAALILVERSLADVVKARDSGDEFALTVALFDLALARLRGCHRLDDAQARDVLTLAPGDVDRFFLEMLLTARGLPESDDRPIVFGPDLSPIPLADEDPPAETEATEPAPSEDNAR